eukprot:s330_g8.t1
MKRHSKNPSNSKSPPELLIFLSGDTPLCSLVKGVPHPGTPMTGTSEDPPIKRTSLRKGSRGSGNPLIQRKLSWKDDSSSTRPLAIGQCRHEEFSSMSSHCLGLEGGLGEEAEPSSSGNQISDRRSAPSQSDHHDIVNSLQQGLDNVDQVIIYDTEHVESEPEEQPVEVQFWHRALKKIHEVWITLCGCHAGFL